MEKIIIANQKMYLNSLDEIKKFQNDLINYKDKFIVAPSYIYLENFVNKGFQVASQNISDKSVGAHTGEVSAKALKDLKVKYTLVGHAELRKKFKEKNLIPKKIENALENGLTVILCIGETKDEKKDGKTFEVIKKKLKNIKPNNNLIISYEPIWSIGNNKIPNDEDLEKIVNYIKSLGHNKVLYGGSVSTENIQHLNKIKNIDGFLIGSSAIKASNLIKIIEVVSK